ncbi:MAG: hypothetical protein Q9209_004066 [Squamulea sp. 1 TL-2023]
MYHLLVTGLTLAVLSILALLNPANVMQTISAGVEETILSASAAWRNPFEKTSILDIADASIALLADHIVPTIIPGSTGTGRPYVVSLSDFANLTSSNMSSANVSDPLIYLDMVRASMAHVDREPFTKTQVFLALLWVVVMIILVGLSVRSHLRSLHITITTLGATISGLQAATPLYATVLGFIERLGLITQSNDVEHDMEVARKSLSQLNTDMRAAGQIPYLPNLISYIEFVLVAIDMADDHYEQHRKTQQSLQSKTNECRKASGERDDALVERNDARDLLERVQERIKALEHVEAKLQDADTRCDSLQNALNAKTAAYDKAHGELECLKTELQSIRGEHLKEGPIDPTPKATSTPQGLNDSTLEPAQARGPSATRSEPRISRGRSSTPTNVSRLGDRPPADPSTFSCNDPPGSPIRSNTGCVIEAMKKKAADEEAARKAAASSRPGDATAAQYGGSPWSENAFGPSSSYREHGSNRHGPGNNQRGKGSNADRGRGSRPQIAPWLLEANKMAGGKLA